MTGLRASLLLLACVPAMTGAALEPQTRRVHVSAFDKKGVPIADLTAEEFTVKENGKERAILNAGPATGPLQIAILVDDNGTGLFRVGVGRFIEALLGRAEFSISTTRRGPEAPVLHRVHAARRRQAGRQAECLGETQRRHAASPDAHPGQVSDGLHGSRTYLDQTPLSGLPGRLAVKWKSSHGRNRAPDGR
jgi:hypothetical protein